MEGKQLKTLEKSYIETNGDDALNNRLFLRKLIQIGKMLCEIQTNR